MLAVPDVVYLDRFEEPEHAADVHPVRAADAGPARRAGSACWPSVAASDVERVIEAGLPRLGPRTITGRTMFGRP